VPLTWCGFNANQFSTGSRCLGCGVFFFGSIAAAVTNMHCVPPGNNNNNDNANKIAFQVKADHLQSCEHTGNRPPSLTPADIQCQEEHFLLL